MNFAEHEAFLRWYAQKDDMRLTRRAVITLARYRRLQPAGKYLTDGRGNGMYVTRQQFAALMRQEYALHG